VGKLNFLRPGVHWKHLEVSEPQLYSLAKARNHLRAPSYLPRTIPVKFGSRNGELTLRKVNKEAIRIYRFGHCTLMALALHRLLGYDLVLFNQFYDGNMWRGHAAVKLPDGRFLDIAGIFKNEKAILASYNFTAPAQVVSVEEFHAVVIYDEPPTRDLFSYVGNLEKLVTYDFAKHLIEVHRLTPLR
jgi:hypothetical protein